MATPYPVGFNVQHFRNTVRTTYDRIARYLEIPLHFQAGTDDAVNLLRDERNELDNPAKRGASRFAGFGNPLCVDVISKEETVIDTGSGVSSTTRRRFEMMGFTSCDARILQAIRPWLRVGPAVCGIWMAVGLISDSAAILWVLAPFAALGAILPIHPVDVPYNFVIRRWTRTPRLPSYGAPRRFSCVLAGVWVSATAWALASRSMGGALVLGSIFMASSAAYVTTDFCLGSWIYHWRRLLS
jgi:hypothetical protein